MANKTKRLSINALENAIKDNYPTTTTVEWNGLQVVIRRNITLTEMMALVDSVISNCFSEQDGLYRPELKDFAIKSATIELYTNLSTPANVHKKYDLIYAASDIWRVIMANIDMGQFDDMLLAIDEKLGNMASANVSLIGKQISSMNNALEDVQAHLSSLFDGIRSEDMKGFIEAMSKGALDEKKIVDAVLAAKTAKE